MKLGFLFASVVSAWALTAAAQPSDDVPKTPLPPQTPVVPFGEPGQSMLSVKDLMRHVLNPAAEAFWLAGGEIDTAGKAKSRTPTTEAKWNGALANAATVMETGNMLRMEGRSLADPDWAKWSADLNKAGLAGIKAAQAHDGEATFAAGSAMFEACRSCHLKYIRVQRQEWAPLPEIPDDFKPKAKPAPKPRR